MVTEIRAAPRAKGPVERIIHLFGDTLTMINSFNIIIKKSMLLYRNDMGILHIGVSKTRKTYDMEQKRD